MAIERAVVAIDFEPPSIEALRWTRRGALNILGGTAAQLLRTSSVPVFVAHTLPVGPARRILAAVDASPNAGAVVDLAAELAQANGGDLGIVHAIDPVLRFHMRRGVRASAASRVDEMLRERARDWLAHLSRAVGLSTPCDVARHVVIGNPSQEIIAIADRDGYDLIVMGTRGAGAIQRTLLGSVATSVLRSGGRPVLFVTREVPEPTLPAA